MLFSNLHRFLLASTVFSFHCSARPLNARGSGDVFHIYAFGDNISGLQVFYADGVAKLGDPIHSVAAEVIPVHFTISDTDEYTWLAHADSGNATWSTKALYMANAGSSEVGFAAPSSAGKLTNVWWTYGKYVMVNIEDANFYAQPIAGAAGWYTLSWSSSKQAKSDKTLVTLRTIEPSTNSVLA